MKEQNYEIRKGKTEIDVLHKDTILTFTHPAYGQNNYSNLKELIEKDSLNSPTMSETASLVYQAFINDKEEKEPEFNDIKKIMKDRWLWGFTGILYTPKLIYIQDNPETRNGRPFMDESELVKKLEQKDPNVRTLQYGFKLESMSSLDLAKNPFVIALAGEEGADKLAQVADTFKSKPYLGSFKSVDENLTRVSALYSYGYLDHRLSVGGGNHGDDRGGCALGVRHKNFSSGNKE